MASRKKKYQSVAVVTEIQAMTKISSEIKNTWYTIQYGETRTVPADCDLAKEKQILQDDVYNEVYKQISDIHDLCNQK